MKPVDKKDVPKLIALIVLAVGVFGFFVVQMAAPPPAASKAPAASEAKGAGTGTAGGSAAAAAAARTPAAAADADAEAAAGAGSYDPTRVVFSPTGRDPFTPNGAAAVSPDSQQGRLAMRAAGGAAATTLVATTAGVPRLPSSLGGLFGNSKPLPNAQPGASAAPTPPTVPTLPGGPVIIEPPAPPEYEVTGVVLGEGGVRSVAILRGADNERRFVMVGDDFGRGFIVSAIHANGIDVRDPSGSTERVVTIKLGNTESSRAN